MHVTKRYPDAAGGDAFVVQGLEREQIAVGHEVTVLTSRSPEIKKLDHVIQFGFLLKSTEIDSINHKRIATLLLLTVRGFGLLRRTRPDVIHAHSTDLGFALSLGARWYRIPRVITLHGTSIGKNACPRLKRLLETVLLRAGGYRLIINIDPTAGSSLEALGFGGRLEYVPNGIFAGEFAYDDSTATQIADDLTPTILAVGRLEMVKGMTFLLQAFSKVACGESRAQLVIAGHGSLESSLRAEARELGIDGSVAFVGQRSRAEIGDLYRRATILVLPSLHEGFPLVLLEAWAHALPVVVTNVGAVPYVCVSGVDSLVVEPANPEMLASALKRLLGDPSLRAKLGAAGRGRVDGEFDQKKIATRVLEIYERVQRDAAQH
jgi:glycosyltransferase involved in cell wall biosynthesis